MAQLTTQQPTILSLLDDAGSLFKEITTKGMPTAATAPTDTTTPWTPVYPDPDKCNYFISNKNTTEYFQFSNPYGGIPQNLLINAIGWIVLLLLFTVLRRAAGNYGRLAIIRKEDDQSKWTEVFFSTNDATEDGQVDEESGRREERIGNGVVNPMDEAGDVSDTQDYGNDGESDSVISVTDWGAVDRGIFSWVTSIFTISDDMILRKCGSDAVQYIKFQRHLTMFLIIITAVCLTIILPINFTMGNIQGDQTSFGHTTISNLPANHSVLWVHIVLSTLFIPLGIYFMRRFSVSLQMWEEDNSSSSRTLMFEGVPERVCNKDLIICHFQEAYPTSADAGFEIMDVQIGYNVSKLTYLHKQLDIAQRAITYCEKYISKKGARLEMWPHRCGIFCGGRCLSCCCPSNKIDALDFYKEMETRLMREVEREQSILQSKPIGVAFVTFSNLEAAKKVHKDFNRLRWDLCGNSAANALPGSSQEAVLMPHTWEVRFAPPREDIYWENLCKDRHFRVLKVWVMNISLFFLLFFFTSPAYLISQLETLPVFNNKTITDDLKVNLPSYITDFVPTLLLWTLSALLPVIVAYSDWWLGHWRRSVENLWIMRKVFGFLLVMVLILPSIGFTTLRAFAEAVVKNRNSNDTRINWECIFLPDNGAFFLNYVITSAFVGTGLEIMRFPELFMYAFRMSFIRSKAEKSSVRREILYEFPFGVNYAWILLIFALTMSYSLVCPLITPFGLVYILIKQAADRYNIYFAYNRSKINKNIHTCAINCVMISLLLQQLILLFFNTVRANGAINSLIQEPRAVFLITMFTIFSFLFIFQMFFHSFKGISPIQYIQRPQQHSLLSDPNNSSNNVRQSRPRQYVPDVLRRFDMS